jgi:hypothetical protein
MAAITGGNAMTLLVSVLYLMLNIAILLLVAAIIWWVLGWLGIPIDPWVLKICQVILALLILILVVSWFAGVFPSRGLFGTYPFRTGIAGAALAALS